MVKDAGIIGTRFISYNKSGSGEGPEQVWNIDFQQCQRDEWGC